MNAEEILRTAHDLVSNDRKAAYGDALDGMVRLAIALNAWLHMSGNPTKRPLTAKDAAMLHVMSKIARSQTGPHRGDNYIDLAGWASIAGEVAEQEAS
jgi:hypothetical protein